MKTGKGLDNILDECVEQLLAGETIEQCLQRYPEQASELEPMLRTALSIGRVSAVQPRPEFKARARYEFNSALQVLQSRKGSRSFNWQPRWATAMVAVVVVLAMGGGTVVAAGNSMPDEPLYPVKLATEEVRLAFTRSDVGKAELHAKMAQCRVEEIAHMASRGKVQHVEMVARHLDDELAKVALLSGVGDVKSGVVMSPERVMLAPQPSVTALPSPPFAPGVTQVAPRVAMPGPAYEKNDAGEKNWHPDIAKKRDMLKEAVKRQAKSDPDRLRAILKAVPEEYIKLREALLRAIAVSETGYQKAIESMDGSETTSGE